MKTTILFTVMTLIALCAGYRLRDFNQKNEVAFYRVHDGYIQKSTAALASTGEMVWTNVGKI